MKKAKESPAKTVQNEMVLTGIQLAEMLNLGTRRVQQLAEEGILVKAARGKYKATESIQNYIRTLQDKSGAKDAGSVDYFDERARHEKAKREIAEIELSVMRGDLHKSEDVKFVMNDMLAAFRSRIMALPAKLAPQLVGCKLPAIMNLLTKEVREALMELSEYNPQVFYAKSTEYVELSDDDHSD
ncbi:hypothetical protein ACHHV8_33580 [Paenibacillus sp. TAB 01]|uniref:hypothetical protein n=1 Tax=Paenibacillus sp. TAB 01 TaxID=3368988 RepID=UPI0037537831